MDAQKHEIVAPKSKDLLIYLKISDRGGK